MRVLYYAKYYENEAIRQLCHGIKEKNLEIVNTVTSAYKKLLLGRIDKDTVLTAMPGHKGYINDYMKSILKNIASDLNCKYYDNLEITPLTDTVYNLKKNSKLIPERFVLKGPNSNTKLLVIDNVIDTGSTAKVIETKYKNMILAVLAITDNTLIITNNGLHVRQFDRINARAR